MDSAGSTKKKREPWVPSWTMAEIQVPSKQFMTLGEVSRLIGYSSRQVKRWLAKGQFPEPIRVCGKSKRWTSMTIGLWLACQGKNARIENVKRPVSTYVYFALSGDFVKIGVADDPDRRLAGLQTANPTEITLIHLEAGGRPHEKMLHRKFAAHRVRSNGEWFRYVDEIKEYIASNGAVAEE